MILLYKKKKKVAKNKNDIFVFLQTVWNFEMNPDVLWFFGLLSLSLFC